jgi:integrase
VRCIIDRANVACCATPQQVGALCNAAPPRWLAFVALCAFAGLRLGEAAALQVGDVDFLRRQMKVQRQVQRPGGTRVDIRSPKYGSERVIFMPPGLVEILAGHVAEYCPGDDPGRWMFTGRDGLPPQHNIVGFWWRRARIAAGCPAVRLHDLRHFYASGLIADGCDVVTVQRALGHASAAVTLNTYAHLWPTAEDRTRKAAAAVMASALGTSATQAQAEPSQSAASPQDVRKRP